MPIIAIPRGLGRLSFETVTGDGYTISPARYAKGKTIVRTPSASGWKTRAGRLAEAIARGNYTGREHGYVMSPAQAERFQRLYWEGWEACVISGELTPPVAIRESRTV